MKKLTTTLIKSSFSRTGHQASDAFASGEGGSCWNIAWRGRFLPVFRLARAAYSEFRLARERLLVLRLPRAILSESLLASLAKRYSSRFTLAKRNTSRPGLAKRDSSRISLASRYFSRLQTWRPGDSVKTTKS